MRKSMLLMLLMTNGLLTVLLRLQKQCEKDGKFH